MNLLELLLENLFLYDAENGGGGDDPQPADPKPADPEPKADPAFKSFEKEEDFNNFVKSERSKAKKEVMDELGVKNLNEAKEGLTSYATLQTTHTELQTKHNELNENYALDKAGIKDDHRNDALILAKARMSDEVGLEEALGLVVKDMPFVAGKGFKGNMGGERKTEDEEGADDTLKAKYPWLK